MKKLQSSISLFLIFIFAACANAQTNTVQSQIRYLALGDSYTIGESVTESERWPIQLGTVLQSKGFNISETDIIATTGWTTAELMDGIKTASPHSEYGLVSLLIGVNNQYRGYDFEIYETELIELVDKAIGFAGGDTSKVFMVSIPNYGVTPFGQSRGENRIRQELLEYDAYANTIAKQYGIPFLNITPISEKAKMDPSYIAEDQLHPSGKMYSEWVELMIPTVEKLLSGQ